jgi:hypothetical protein
MTFRAEGFHEHGRRNLMMTRELLAILELFATHRIAAIPYKGPLLAAAEYGNLAERTFCDLDILVRRQDVLRARDLLVARGYVPEHRLTPTHEAAWLRARNDINLRRPGLDIVVELHWEVVPRRLCTPFDNDRLWAQTQIVSLGGRDVRTLSPENLLLVLCVHGAKHRWSRMIWITDVAAVVSNHRDLNWSDVIGEARRMGVERMLLVGLRLASDVAACELPEHVGRLTDDCATVRLAQDIRTRLATSATTDNALQRSLFHLKIRERLRDKIRFGLYTALVPSAGDRILIGLPPSLAPLYYVLRPFRLARKYFRRPAMASRRAATP